MSYRDEIGHTLRDARQAAGLTLRDVAAKIRIKPVYLEAIEAGQFERLPALPQTVGFTRSYAQLLAVNVDAPLARLGEEVHRDIEKTDYSARELPWAEVSMSRIVWVVAGAALGMVLLATMIFDFGAPLDEVLPIAEVPLERLVSRAAPIAPVVAPAAAPPVEEAAVATNSSVSGAPPVTVEMAALLNSLAAEDALIAEAVAPVSSAGPQLFALRDVHLRAAPANAGNVIGVLSACEALAFIGSDTANPWRQVQRVGGATGWVYHRYVADSAPASCR